MTCCAGGVNARAPRSTISTLRAASHGSSQRSTWRSRIPSSWKVVCAIRSIAGSPELIRRLPSRSQLQVEATLHRLGGLVEPDYKGFRIEVTAVGEGDRWNGNVMVRRTLSKDTSR